MPEMELTSSTCTVSARCPGSIKSEKSLGNFASTSPASIGLPLLISLIKNWSRWSSKLSRVSVESATNLAGIFSVARYSSFSRVPLGKSRLATMTFLKTSSSPIRLSMMAASRALRYKTESPAATSPNTMAEISIIQVFEPLVSAMRPPD